VHIGDTRAILEDKIVQTKVARRWQSMIGHQLDEILVSNNRLARTSFKVLGMWEEQRSELQALKEHVHDLHSDMGALKERLSQSQSEKDKMTMELTAIRTSGVSVPEPSTARIPIRPLPPPVEFVDIDDDCLMVVSPTGEPYAAVAAKPKRAAPRKRENFPRLESPTPVVNRVSVRKRLGKTKTGNDANTEKRKKARYMEKARSTIAGPRFEVTTDDNGWKDLRRSIEQKLPNPRVRTLKAKNGGMILFPEDAETAAALRRTSNLVEKAPRKHRVMLKFVDRLLEKDEIPWALGKNASLGISEPEQASIKPLFMLGPRDGHTVHWVIEVSPAVLKKVEGKYAYLGLTKCRMKIHDAITQCYNCQGFGHTA